MGLVMRTQREGMWHVAGLDPRLFPSPLAEDRTLSITGRRLTPDDVDALAAALARGTPNPIDDIEVLILSRTRLRADGCVALARALEVNTTVHTVSFFRNRIGADGAEALARLLDVNTTITTLNCGVNRCVCGQACRAFVLFHIDWMGDVIALMLMCNGDT